MIISELLKSGCDILSGTVENPRAEAEYLLCEIIKKDRLYLSVHKSSEIMPVQEKTFLEFCKRRSVGEPFAYIAGHREFMSLDFAVDKRVLIPRPETELLVETVIENHKNATPHILDVCTGSGAIACSLAVYIENAVVCGIDISEDALEVARQNAKNLVPKGNISFFKANALEKISLNEKFDIVVSNPPYIESSIIETLDTDVKNHEPRLALDGGNDGLIFYRKIVQNIDNILKPDGMIYFEIGYNQGEAVCAIMEKRFRNISITKDYAGLDRIVCGQLEYDS